MNSNTSLVPLCPQCHNYSFISFPNRTYCDVYCCCGYREQLYIKDYLNILKDLSSSQSLTCKEHQQNFTFFCDDCKEHLCSKCEESHNKSHMLLSLSMGETQFSTLLNKHNKTKLDIINELTKLKVEYQQLFQNEINSLLQNIAKIENSYTKAVEDNNNILSLIDCMFNSYNKDSQNYSSISNINRNTNYKIQIFEPKSKDIAVRVTELIKYYDSFMVLKPKTRDIYHLIHINEYEQKFNKQQKTNVKKLLITRKGGVAVLITHKRSFKIYQDDCCFKIMSHFSHIKAIDEFLNGTFITCSDDGTIQLHSLPSPQSEEEILIKKPSEIIEKDNRYLVDVKVITNNRFISVDREINIRKSSPPYEIITTYKIERYKKMIQLEDKEILMIIGDLRLTLINLITYKIDTQIKLSESITDMIQLSNGDFAIGHNNSLSIMNGKTFKIEAVINCPQVTAISQLSTNILYITSSSVGLFFLDIFHREFYFYFKYSEQKYKGGYYTVNDIKYNQKTKQLFIGWNNWLLVGKAEPNHICQLHYYKCSDYEIKKNNYYLY